MAGPGRTGWHPPQRCALRFDVTVYPDRPTVLEIDAASLSLAEPPTPSADPTGRYPLSVVEHPGVSVQLSYTGYGRLEAWADGRWVAIGTLNPTVRRSVARVAVPGWAQGRNINLVYHEHHVYELDWFVQNTDCGDLCRRYGRHWLDHAPAEWWRLPHFA